MKEEFDFEKIGKQTPYKVPPDFFNTVTENTLAEAESRVKENRRNIFRIWPSISVAASFLLLLIAGYFIFTNKTEEKGKMAQIVHSKTPDIILPEVTDTLKPRAVQQNPAAYAKAEPEKQKEQSPVVAKIEKQQITHAPKQETLDEILAGITDKELLELAALAETELYVYEETIGDE
jgi:hypothetical protein